MSFSEIFLKEAREIIEKIDASVIEKMVEILKNVRKNRGRLFLLGSGGGAGHASHAVCDFRKLCNIESYAPYDNVSELTARVNDEGWDVTISNWLEVSNLNKNDCLFIFSVGGGNEENNISTNLVNAVKLGQSKGTNIIGIVGKDGGYTKLNGNAVLIIPTISKDRITPFTEGFQAVIWHLLVSHPDLQINATKWESVKK